MYYSFIVSLFFNYYHQSTVKNTPGGYIILYDNYNSYKDNYLPPHPKDSCLEDNISLDGNYCWYKGNIPVASLSNKGKLNSHQPATVNATSPRSTRSSKKLIMVDNNNNNNNNNNNMPKKKNKKNKKKDDEEELVDSGDDDEEEQLVENTTLDDEDDIDDDDDEEQQAVLARGVDEAIVEGEAVRALMRKRNATK